MKKKIFNRWIYVIYLAVSLVSFIHYYGGKPMFAVLYFLMGIMAFQFVQIALMIPRDVFDD